eukprot:TRINITY_DN9867_c0_g1_i1.p1 TRINITY_DN9867_c0_g1~~TRINITY_DN9867_c0_g1_i1.p1  ORF type:complete len:1054 (-),score=242.80 TRINITY_DN9867_c0_g1_i1:33-3194(-)
MANSRRDSYQEWLIGYIPQEAIVLRSFDEIREIPRELLQAYLINTKVEFKLSDVVSADKHRWQEQMLIRDGEFLYGIGYVSTSNHGITKRIYFQRREDTCGGQSARDFASISALMVRSVVVEYERDRRRSSNTDAEAAAAATVTAAQESEVDSLSIGSMTGSDADGAVDDICCGNEDEEDAELALAAGRRISVVDTAEPEPAAEPRDSTFATELDSLLGDELQQSKTNLFEHLAQQRHATPEPTASAPIRYHVPQPSAHFCGRIAELYQLVHFLARPPGLSVLVAGQTGLGKRELVAEFIRIHGDKYNAIYWLRAESREHLMHELIQLARELGLLMPQERASEAVRDALRVKLAQVGNWLFVCDGVVSEDDVTECFPMDAGHVIMISDDDSAQMCDFMLYLDPLAADDAAMLLQKATATPRIASALILTDLVMNHPLYVNLLAAYIVNTYGKGTAAQGVQLLIGQLEPTRESAWTSVTEQAWSICSAGLPAEAMSVLRFCSVMNARAVPLDLVDKWLRIHCGQMADLASALGELTTRAMITVVKGVHVSLSPCIQRLVREHVLMSDIGTVIAAAVDMLASVFICKIRDSTTWSNAVKLMPHVRSLLDHCRTTELQSDVVVSLLHNLGLLSMMAFEFAAAQRIYDEALEMSRTLHPHEQTPELGELLLCRGAALCAQNKFSDAMPDQCEGLAVYLSLYGPQHLSTTTAMYEVAQSYLSLGRAREALDMQSQAMEMMRTLVSPADPNHIRALFALATYHRANSDKQEAIRCHTDALELFSQHVGDTHSDTLECMWQLAMLYSQTENYVTAITHVTNWLKKRKQLYPPGSLPVAMSKWQATTVLSGHDMHEKCVRMLMSAMPTVLLLGEAHPLVFKLLNDVATLQTKRGQLQAALTISEVLLVFQRTALSESHQMTIDTVLRIADLYMQLGRYDQAHRLQAAVVAELRRLHGEVSVQVATAMQLRTRIYGEIRRPEDARSNQQRVVEILAQLLPVDNAQLLHARVELTLLLLKAKMEMPAQDQLTLIQQHAPPEMLQTMRNTFSGYHIGDAKCIVM